MLYSHLLRLALFCCLLLIVPTSRAAADQKKEVRLAVVLPLKNADETGRRSMEFYLGLLLAADHLRNQGISARITTLDEGKENAYLDATLRAAAPTADALVGFAYTQHAVEAASFGLSHEMPVFLPFLQSIPRQVAGNAFAAVFVPDEEAMAQGVCDLLLSTLGKVQAVVLQSETSEMSAYTQRLTELLDKQGAKVKVLPINASPYNIADALSTKRFNLVLTAATEKDVLRNVAQKLRSVGEANPKKRLAIVGHPSWYELHEQNQVRWDGVEVFIPTTMFYNAAAEKTKTLLSQYEAWFHDAAAVASPNALLLGYDAGWHIICGMAQAGRSVLQEESKTIGLYTDIQLRPSRPSACRSNHAVRLLNIKPSGAIDLLAF